VRGCCIVLTAVATELRKKVVWSGRGGKPNYADLFMQAKMHDAVLVAHISASSARGGKDADEREGHDEDLLMLLRSAIEGGPDWGSFEEEMEKHNGLVILTLSSAAGLPKQLRKWVSLLVELDEPDHILRRQIWEAMRPGDVALAEDVDLAEVSLKWSLNAGMISSAWVMSQLSAVLRDGENPRITQADLMRAARNQLEEMLRMANVDVDKMAGPVGLDRVVLPPSVKENLKMIVDNAKACDVVYGQWGFRPDHAATSGVKALFYGPPGTGKTHAAHCIAYELGKTLKIANAAQLISKFVGETGKNLQSLFREVRSGGIVLPEERFLTKDVVPIGQGFIVCPAL
jgi:hypothetical protein